MKPTITKGQADALLRLYSEEWTRDDVLSYHATGDWGKSCSALNDLDIMTLAAALVNGYEVEKTPEEKVREYHRSLVCDMERALSYAEEGNYRSAIEAVEETLGLLGIKIEGVNA
ncbi:hypothetical protein [Bacillus subtilis]|uniref:hypothetical protein n=1 Tax=Bacillus subtilis TaxID=1423 RepID=UPI003D7F4524